MIASPCCEQNARLLACRAAVFFAMLLAGLIFGPVARAAEIAIVNSGTTSATSYSLGGTAYTQSFDTLPSSGTVAWANDTTIPGWSVALTSGALTNATIVITDGASNLGDLRVASAGTAGAGDRALALHTQLDVAPTYIGLGFQNTSGRVLERFSLAYTAEQWRESGSARNLTFTVQYRIGATAADLNATSGWTTLAPLTATTLSGSAGAATTLAANDIAVTIPSGTSIWFRWRTSNSATSATSSNDILAIDNVSASFVAAPDGSPVITTQPEPQSVNLGSGVPTGVTFSVVATGDAPLTYQWRKDGTEISGATSASYAISTVQAADAGDYTVVVTNAKGSATSAVATLTVTNTVEAPEITTHPQSQSADLGATVQFSVVATGGLPLAYQWQKNGAPIAGANSATLTLTNVTASVAGSYNVVVSNSAGSFTSLSATLSLNGVITPPFIVEQSGSQSVVVGGAVSFTVTAAGSAPFTYQWNKNGTPIDGATSVVLALSNVTLAAAGDYTVTVSNGGGSVTSEPATLTVTEPPAGSDSALFVAPDGLAGNPGTYAQPTTLANAIAIVPAGGTIYLRGGTYTYNTQITIARGNNGAAGLHKRIFAYTPPGGAAEKPVLDFSSQPYGSTSQVSNPRGVFIGGNYWHLKGLEVKGAADNGIFVAGNYNIVELCVTHKNRDSGLQIARYSSSAPKSEWPSYNLILNCESYDNYDSAPNGGENADGFACKLTSGPGNIFRGCIAHHNIDDGWDLYTKSDTGAIDPVVIDQCISYNNGTLTDGTQNSAGDRNGFKLGGEKIAVAHYVSRSIAFKNGKNGFTWNSNGGPIQMVNNLAFDNAEGNFKFDLGEAKFFNNVSLWTTSSGPGNRVGVSDRYVGNSGAPTGATNVFWFTGSSSRGPSVNDAGLTAYRTGFVTLTLPANGFARRADGSIDLGDFARPVAGSPLLNAGALPPSEVIAWLPYNTATYYENAPDIGAVETYLASPPVIVSALADQSALPGASVTFAVSVQGTAPFTYQWTKNDVAISGATTGTLTLAAVQLTDSGAYRVTVTNGFGSDTSSATLTVDAPQGPSITTQPQSLTVTEGGAAQFSVVATGTPVLAYQWRKNGAEISGATAATYTISATQLSDAGTYSVLVTNAYGSIPSADVTLTVSAAPAAPVAAVASEVGNTGFTASWSSVSGALGYRLDVSTRSDFATFLSGYQNLDVGTALSRSVTGLTAGTAYYYRVRAIHAAGSSPSSNVVAVLTSGAAATTIDVSQLTWYKSRSADTIAANATAKTVTFTEGQTSSSMYVTNLPSSVTIAAGQKVTFSFTLQTGSSVPSTTNALRIGLYNNNGTALSANPSGDSNTAFTDDTGYMASYVFNTGAGALYGRTPSSGNSNQQQLMGTTGEYTALGAAASTGTSAAFAASTSYSVAITITRLAASTEVSYFINGGTTANYTVTATDSASGSLGTVAFNQFGIRVAGGSNSLNNFTLGDLGYIIESAAPTAPAITTQPAAQDVPIGGNATFTVVASGTAPLTYQWRKNGTDIAGATASTLTLTGVSAADVADYSVVVTNSVDSVTSNAAALTVFTPVLPAITAGPLSQTVNDGATVTFSVTATGTQPFSYQWKKNGTDILGATSATLTLNAVSLASAGNYTVAVTNVAGTVTSATAILTVNAVAPSITTPPAAQTINVGSNATFTVVASGTAPLGYQWQKGTVDIPGATSASYTVTNAQTTDAGNYRVVVSNAAGSVTSAAAALTVVTPQAPTITAQPQSQTVSDGGNVTFSVTATGTQPFSYQWKKNGADITGATSATLTLTGVTPASAGSYSVVVTNLVTSVTSAAATLTVQAVAPSITTQPMAQSAPLGGSATFNVVATGTAPLGYQWQKNGTDIPGATSASYTVTGVQAADFTTYRVVVTNSAGSATSSVVTLSLASGLPVTAFNLTGFATVGTGTTGGGVIPETDAAYRKVTTPLEFVQAIIDSNKTAGKVKVIEIMNDLNLGWTEVGATVQGLASNALRAHATPKLHPVLLQTGVSILDIKARSPLTIFSANGATIRHCNFNVKGTSNIIIRNLKFDELWEWDEASKGDFDSNDWDFITLGNGGDVSNVWIDHCTFTKAYDGIVDMKAGASNVTLSWCRYIGDDGATNPNSWVRQQLAHLEANKSSYAGYRFLRDTVGYTIDELAAIIQGQDKGHLMGANSLKAENALLTATFHHQWFQNVWDRVTPRLRGGNVHNYNIYVDDVIALQARRMRDTKAAATLSTSALNSFNNGSPYKLRPFLNGTISTENGAILVEKSFYSDCITPLRNNQTDPTNPAYTGKILALDTIYRFNNADGSVTQVRGNSTDPNNPLGPFQAAIIPFSWTSLPNNQLPYAAPPMDDPANLPGILAAGAGAGVLTWSKDNWLRTAYVADSTIPPSIVAQPQAVTTTAGADTTFTVQAAGSATLLYQWKKGGVNLVDGARISGANSAVLTISGTEAGDAGDYSVTVSNANGNVTSSVATLTVGAPVAPGIATQPADQSVIAGQGVQFSVVATGSAPFNYQWKKDGVDIVGATGALYEIEFARVEDAGSYSVTVSNLAGNVTSSSATLTVAPSTAAPVAAAATAVGNQGFTANWSAVDRADGYRLDVSTSNTFATFVPGYQNLDVGDAVNRTVTGLSTGTTYYYRVRAYGTGGTSVSSSVITVATTGIAATNVDVSQLTWLRSRTADTVTANTTVQSVTFTEGQTSASGYIAHLAAPINVAVGQTLTLTLTFETGTVKTVANALRFGLFNTQGTRVTDFGNTETTNLVTDDTGYMASYNLDTGNGSLLGRIPGSTNTTLMSSTNAALYTSTSPARLSGAPAPFASSTAYALTLSLTRREGANVWSARLHGGATVDYVLTGVDTTTPSVATQSFDEIALRIAGGTNSLDTLKLTSLQFAVAATPAELAAPTISAQPQPRAVALGAAANFAVTVAGPGPLAYQWRKGGVAIANANGATYTIPAVAETDVGSYDVVITGPGGRVTSSAVALTIAADAYAGWLEQYFTADERANLALSGPTASAAGDGVSNLFKYALGLNPRAPMHGGWHEIENVQGGWVFVYRRPTDRADVGFVVQVSGNLVDWSDGNVVHELESTIDGVETWRAIHVPPAGTTKVFFRLQVTR